MRIRTTREVNHAEKGRRAGRRPMIALNAMLLLLGATAIAASPGGDQAPGSTSDGDCLSVSVYYWLLDEDKEKQYVLGPEHCVVGTGWEEAHSRRVEAGDDLLVDSAIGVFVGVPLPAPTAS